MAKFKVQEIWQVVKTFEVEAENQYQAEEIAYYKMLKECDKADFDETKDFEPYTEEI